MGAGAPLQIYLCASNIISKIIWSHYDALNYLLLRFPMSHLAIDCGICLAIEEVYQQVQYYQLPMQLINWDMQVNVTISFNFILHIFCSWYSVTFRIFILPFINYLPDILWCLKLLYSLICTASKIYIAMPTHVYSILNL